MTGISRSTGARLPIRFKSAREREHKASLECLEIFADAQYPFIVSTKNPCLLLEEPYFSVIQRCRCLLQISAACPKYDKLEPGAPSYEKRLEAARKLSDKVTRIIFRVQPYFIDCKEAILEEIPRYAEAGVYGISTCGFVSSRKQKGMTREGGKYRFTLDTLYPHFKELREVCHNNGLRFFCSEDGLVHLGDDHACCGTMGLQDFKPNEYNCSDLTYKPDTEPTEAMKKPHTARPFRSLQQDTPWWNYIYNRSFAEMMEEYREGFAQWNRQMMERYSQD